MWGVANKSDAKRFAAVENMIANVSQCRRGEHGISLVSMRHDVQVGEVERCYGCA
jgi:hypothetical protein